jgi:hypothetical protein
MDRQPVACGMFQQRRTKWSHTVAGRQREINPERQEHERGQLDGGSKWIHKSAKG